MLLHFLAHDYCTIILDANALRVLFMNVFGKKKKMISPGRSTVPEAAISRRQLTMPNSPLNALNQSMATATSDTPAGRAKTVRMKAMPRRG